MAYERVIATKFVSTGAEKLVNDTKKVGKAMQTGGQAIQRNAGQAKEWLQRNKAAMVAMAAVATGALLGIIKSSPVLNAHLSSIRLAFSLIAMEIGNSLAPALELLEGWVWKVQKGFSELPEPMRDLISFLITITFLVIALNGLLKILGIRQAFVSLMTSINAIAFWASFVAITAYNFVLNVLWLTYIKVAIQTVIATAKQVLNTAATWLAKTAVVAYNFVLNILNGHYIKLAVVAVIAAVKTGIQTAATWLAVTAQWALNAAMSANPIGLIILAVVALIAIVVLMVKHWDKIKAALGKAWGAIKDFFGWIIGLAESAKQWGKDLIVNFANGILDKLKWAWRKIKDAAGWVLDLFSFDNPANDRWAMKSGMDMVKFFNKGVSKAAAGFEGRSAIPGLSPAPTASGSTTTSTSVNIGQIILQGDPNSLAAGSFLGRRAGNEITSQLQRR